VIFQLGGNLGIQKASRRYVATPSSRVKNRIPVSPFRKIYETAYVFKNAPPESFLVTESSQATQISDDDLNSTNQADMISSQRFLWQYERTGKTIFCLEFPQWRSGFFCSSTLKSAVFWNIGILLYGPNLHPELLHSYLSRSDTSRKTRCRPKTVLSAPFPIQSREDGRLHELIRSVDFHFFLSFLLLLSFPKCS
jgi:hypothetical protein